MASKYSLKHALRCHSRNNNPTDAQTAVWAAKFMPNSHIAATCGGDSVCFIDCSRGVVAKKYSGDDSSDNWYSLAWGTIKGAPVLAVAGQTCKIFLIDYHQQICFAILNMGTTRQRKGISALAFAQSNPSWLVSCTEDGRISLWDVEKDGGTVLMKFEQKQNVNGAVFSSDSRWLYTGGNDTMVRRWKLSAKDFGSSKTMKTSDATWGVHPYVVDDLMLMNDDLIVSKSQTGNILVWDSSKAPDGVEVPEASGDEDEEDEEDESEEDEVDMERRKYVRAELVWRDSDSYYMKMDMTTDKRFLVCGDNFGLITGYVIPPKFTSASTVKIQPKLSLSSPLSKEPVRGVTISHDNKYIVAACDGNLVFVWES